MSTAQAAPPPPWDALTPLPKGQDALDREAMAVLAGGLSHEVKNPLFGISGTLEAIADELRDRPHMAGLLDAVRGEIARIDLTMRELTDFATDQTAGFVSPLCPVVREAIDAVRPLADRRRVTISALGLEAAVQVALDDRRLKQALSLLMSFALARSPRGGQISVRVEAVDGAAQLSVSDRGQPLSAEELRRMPIPYAVRRPGAPGIALALALHVLEEHKAIVRAGQAGEEFVIAARLPVK
ncbi:MAG: HAMP domain-containing histidine kinase [Deltaproteobacteria bacterium]|nr:HAMP domain-containing histidine kinase [Deltaproteobacteria bacterium]